MANVTLQLPPGVVRSATPAATPGRWWDSNFVRWQGGGAEPVGGWTKQTSTPLPSAPRAMLSWLLNDNITRCTAFACDGHLYIDTNGGYFNITPTSFSGVDSSATSGGYGSGLYGASTYGTPRAGVTDLNRLPNRWSLDTFGQDLLFNASTDGKLYHWAWSNPAVAATVVSGAPTGVRAMCVTDERAVVVLSGRTVSWSSREDYTDWNFASTTNTAGFLTLSSDTPLVACYTVKDGVLIFSQTDVFLMRFLGAPFVYGIDKIGSNCAPISPQAVGKFEGRACWMGSEGFWAYDGGVVRPIPCDVQDFIFNNNNPQTTRVNAASGAIGTFPEIWTFYPSTNSVENDRYVIWNFVDNWWAIGSLARSCVAPSGLLPYPLMATTAGHIYQHETGWLADGVTRVGSVYAETSTLSVGNGDQVMSVRSAQPDSFTGATATQFHFYARFTREGAETAYGPYQTRTDGYMDVRFQARDVRLRVEATMDANWTVGNMRLDAMPRGRR